MARTIRLLTLDLRDLTLLALWTIASLHALPIIGPLRSPLLLLTLVILHLRTVRSLELLVPSATPETWSTESPWDVAREVRMLWSTRTVLSPGDALRCRCRMPGTDLTRRLDGVERLAQASLGRLIK